MANREVAWCGEVFLPTGDDDDSAHSSASKPNPSFAPTSQRLILLKDRKWPGNGVRLRVGFIDKPSPSLELQKRVVRHMNAWSEFCNVRFTLIYVPWAAEVRVSFTGWDNGKYASWCWSSVGIDVLRKTDRDRPTMMLTGLSMKTDERTFTQFVRHETGHTLGFVHEHLRPELVARLDREKTITAYKGTWEDEMTIAHVLTPLWTEDSSRYLATEVADVHSIMCYPIGTRCLKDNMKDRPITGGRDISIYDKGQAAKIYPIHEPDAWVLSSDKQTIGIAASGEALFLRLESGEIRQVFDFKDTKIGEVDDPITTKLIASGDRLYRLEAGGCIYQWNGTFGSDTKEWSRIEKNPQIVQVETCGKHIYYRTESGMIATYRNGTWTNLYRGKDTTWISATENHLYRQDDEGEIYELPIPHDWKRIGGTQDYADSNIVQIATTWRNVYQHCENGDIWMYAGVDQNWTRVYRQQKPKPFLIEASEDRLFRIEVHEHDDGSDVWVNDDNTEEGWKSLEIEKNWSYFIYTGGFVWEFVRETGDVTRYIGAC
ncbi:hypothetical protein V5O48_013028 [Marasmius crinis-equi]|uniref:Peptidase metallopeptidase domain-containing protein n=1 Tax=Marasmius crinis-equi TaxID=585013 RepID=A0ABR3F163_9AGAR